MPEINSNLQMNPQVCEMQVGIRTLRNITIYPLSVRDQLKTTELVKSALTAFFGAYDKDADMADAMFVSFFLDTLQSHLDKLMPMITDVPEEVDLLADMTNEQLAAVLRKVYEVNYSFLSDTVKTLFGKLSQKAAVAATTGKPLITPLQKFVESTGIDPTTSTAEAGATVG